MASNLSYSMGQIRYNPNENYYENTNIKPHAINTEIGENTQLYYQDVVLCPDNPDNFSFEYGKPYYLRIEIPKNLSYDLVFNLKLVNVEKNNSSYIIKNVSEEYQAIKKFKVIRKVFDSQLASRIILYPTYKNGYFSEENVSVAIVKENMNNLSIGDVFLLDNKYYLKINNRSNGFIEILNSNDTILSHTWKTKNIDDEYDLYDFVFSNKISEENFNGIFLELVRNDYDNDIQWTSGSKDYYGLHVDIDKIQNKVNCYKLKNLVEKTPSSILNNIGVWAHPETVMAINGEEIRVGQSGYYELKDYDITNLGIVAQDITDKFSVDYQYKIG